MGLNLFLDFCQYIIDQIVIKFYVSKVTNEIVYCALESTKLKIAFKAVWVRTMN
jgi:hypothetical protein